MVVRANAGPGPDSPGVPLTAEGGKFPLEGSLREMLCLMEDGRLLVSKSHAFNPHVKGFIGRLQRIGHPYHVFHVDMSVIAAAYEGAKTAAKKATSSEMQDVVRDMFRRAVQVRASDIHVRVSSRFKTQVFFRIHNDLEFIEEHSYDHGNQLCTTIYQSMADVSDATFETLSRQDARISDREKIPDGLDGIRIATSPQVNGYVMVMRLLYNDAAETLDPTALGYSGEQADCLSLMKRCPTGINVIGGPTGSGKSTTLQRLLASIIKESEGRKHIITVEDPPEYPIYGAVQTPVANVDTEEERSRAFQSAIKAAMRLDPDVIMIGEVRDTPSARLAVQAAMTGHQVWTTVHANGQFAILDRMIDLGVPKELVFDPSIITGLACQRLLKTLCPSCKKPLTEAIERYSESDLRRILSVAPIDQLYVRGDGCEHCRRSGTSGRTVVAETVVTNERLMGFLRKQDRIGAINYWRTELHGMSMIDHAIVKIRQGIVDPFQAEEVVGPINLGMGRTDGGND